MQSDASAHVMIHLADMVARHLAPIADGWLCSLDDALTCGVSALLQIEF